MAELLLDVCKLAVEGSEAQRRADRASHGCYETHGVDKEPLAGHRELVWDGLSEEQRSDRVIELVDDGRCAGNHAMEGEAVVFRPDEREGLLVTHTQSMAVGAGVALGDIVAVAHELVVLEVAYLNQRQSG